MAKETIGHFPCATPSCKARGIDADVRVDKNGYFYTMCEHCNGQWIIRTKHGSDSLRLAMRPIAAAVAAIDTSKPAAPAPNTTPPAAAPVPATAPAPAKAAAKPTTRKGFFDGIPGF